MDIAHKDMEINERGRRNPKKGKTDHSLGLEDMAVAQLLPTPTALDKGGGRINKSLSPNAAERPTIPFDVDSLTISFPKWRQESIKAYGNAWVPQVAYEIFRAIEAEENK